MPQAFFYYLMAKKKSNWVERTEPEYAPIKCIWHTRLVIGSNQTVTGNRYEFQPGQVQDVNVKDIAGLLAMIKIQQVCCGGMKADPLRYFTEV